MRVCLHQSPLPLFLWRRRSGGLRAERRALASPWEEEARGEEGGTRCRGRGAVSRLARWVQTRCPAALPCPGARGPHGGSAPRPRGCTNAGCMTSGCGQLLLELPLGQKKVESLPALRDAEPHRWPLCFRLMAVLWVPVRAHLRTPGLPASRRSCATALLWRVTGDRRA